MADVVIVGHGTSLEGAGLGSIIDSYDCPIVRLIGFMHGCGVEDRGSRVDYLCTTARRYKKFLADKVVPTRELWVYVHRYKFPTLIPKSYKGGPLYIDNLREWAIVYDKLRTRRTVNFFCKGLASVIIAAKRLDIDSILLFGFDNLWRGESRNFETMGLGKVKGVYTTSHDYAAERKVLDIVSTKYGVIISHIDMWDIKWTK
jgi:hypothetical protein